MKYNTVSTKDIDAWRRESRLIGGKFREGYLFGLNQYLNGIPPLDQYDSRSTIWAAGYRLGVRGKGPV